MASAGAAAGTASLHEQRSLRARAAFSELPNRYLGAPDDLDATFQIRLGDVGRTWEVRLRGERCDVHPSPTREPDVVIGTDAATWLALREGRLSGLDAFSQRRLYARGDLDLALGFEGLFRLPGGRDPLLRVARGRDLARPGHDADRRRRARARRSASTGSVRTRPRSSRRSRRSRPRLHRARARPARLRLLRQARPRCLRRALVRRPRSSATWTRSGSTAPT